MSLAHYLTRTGIPASAVLRYQPGRACIEQTYRHLALGGANGYFPASEKYCLDIFNA
ncbi:hypothetical protein [Spirosoma sp. 209]|uniref:hypothetical protein n=1 Tax=Spirosoma sp. 209 TaxID=1955701 RepID=UPI0013747130|nr:hypothetical protein [Spirosoma sp. 209]